MIRPAIARHARVALITEYGFRGFETDSALTSTPEPEDVINEHTIELTKAHAKTRVPRGGQGRGRL